MHLNPHCAAAAVPSGAAIRKWIDAKPADQAPEAPARDWPQLLGFPHQVILDGPSTVSPGLLAILDHAFAESDTRGRTTAD